MPGEVEPGIYTDGKGTVVQAACDYTEAYLEKNVEKIYFKEMLSEESGFLGFEIENTQKYDDAMSAGICLISVKQKKYIKPIDTKADIESIMPYSKAI
jgi:hypothetical protein